MRVDTPASYHADASRALTGDGGASRHYDQRMGWRGDASKTPAARFAWRFMRPGDKIDLEPEVPAAPVDTRAHANANARAQAEIARAASDEVTELEVERAEARYRCATLALAIDRTWAIADASQQRAAVRELARRAAKLGVSLAAMQEHPLESARLARLFVRHFAQLGPGGRHDAAGASLWLDYTHRDAVELVIETVRAEATDIADAMALAFETEEQDADFGDTLTPRLTAELDAATSIEARLIALRWLAVVGTKGAAPALRRALRLPNVAVRGRALEILLELDPCPLEASDVETLLEETAYEGPPDEAGAERDDCFGYARALLDAIVKVRPPEGAELLYVVAEQSFGHELDFDRAWALEALGAAYPASALALIDHDAGSTSTHVRAATLDAIARLPQRDARPRLLLLANDASPRVAERAREIFADTGLGMCPSDPTAGVATRLLDGRPSDRFISRLLVLRGRARDARLAMMRVLLREAPDRESLVLLTFALGDDELWHCGGRERLPWDAAGWCKRLVSRFGAPAVAALAALAERYPNEAHGGWLQALTELVSRGAIPKRDAGPIRDVALARLRGGWSGHVTSLRVLAALDPTAEWRDALWAVLANRDAEVMVRFQARELLAAWRDPAVEERLASELDAALVARDYRQLGDLLFIGGKRGSTHAIAIAERALAEVHDRDAIDTLVACAELLDKAGRLPRGFVDRALMDPEKLAFTIAARLLSGTPPKETREKLLAALSSQAREGAAAVEAADALLFLRPALRTSDPRLLELLGRASVGARARLLYAMLLRKAPFEPLRSHVVDVLTHATEQQAEDLVEHLVLTRARAGFLREILPRMKDEGLRAQVRSWIGDTRASPRTGNAESN